MTSEAISSYSLDQILIMLLDKRGVVPSKLDSDWMKEGNLVISADDSNSDGSISFDRSKFIDDPTFERWMGSSTLQNGDIILTSEGGSFSRVSRIRVDSVEKMNEQMKNLAKANLDLVACRDALLPRLMSGELKVN